MVNFKYDPNELGIKNVWWGKEEKYWIEISNKDKNEEHKKYRGDFGSDLRAPTKDWSGNRNISTYSILGLVRPNDVIFHCSTTKKAIIGKSLAKDFPYVTQGTYFSPHATRFSGAPKFPKRTIYKVKLKKYEEFKNPIYEEQLDTKYYKKIITALNRLYKSYGEATGTTSDDIWGYPFTPNIYCGVNMYYEGDRRDRNIAVGFSPVLFAKMPIEILKILNLV